MAKIFPIDFEEKNTIAQDDYILFSDSEDWDKIKKAQYSNLKWEKWDQWIQWPQWCQGIQWPEWPQWCKGDPWNAATVCVGSVSTLAPWCCATVCNSWTQYAAVLDFGIPQWATWCTGDTWARICAAKFCGNDMVFNETNGCQVTIVWAKTTLTWPQGCQWPQWCQWPQGCTWPQWCTWPAGNWIACVTSSKAWKVTTVDITCTNGCSYCFSVCDGADGQWSGDVLWPASACDWNLAVFDGTSGKLIKDWGAIPAPTTVVDNLNSTSTTSALSANQWKVLDGKISDLFGLWKFLSLWDATTWLPDSFPLETPYTYTTWDYFLVETVSSATPPVNYKPVGSSYDWTASTTTESDELEAWDVYIYDGTTWLLQSNHWKTVSFTNIAWDAMDNANLSWYLNMKAFYLSSTSDLTTAQKAFEWQNWGKTAIVVYSNKPYAFSFYNTAQMHFACLFYREQAEASNDKTSLVRDVITLSITGGTTVSSISANARNNIIASVLKTDTDYATPYTPQYNGSPATKKYVDDKISDTAFAASWDGDTTHAPSKNAVYDVLWDVETLLANL